MRTMNWIAWLLLSLAGSAMAQQTGGRLAEPGVRRKLDGLSHIEVDLGQHNTLIVGFNRYAQVLARQNIDSVLRLFVADYRQVEDTAQSPTRATHALFRLGQNDRALDLRSTPQPTTSFRFRDDDAPLQVKTQQDTLQIVWASINTRVPYRDFSVYLFVNTLNDVKALLAAGGLNGKLQTALASVRTYKGHDLTDPKMSFDMTLSADQRAQFGGPGLTQAQFIGPGLARAPFISFHPGLGVGLIRNQWVPSLNLDVQFVPSRLLNVGYSVGYTSTFFFSQSATDGRFQTFRNDFLNIGLAFYYFNKDGQTSAFSRQIFAFYVGVPVHRRGPYFERDAIRLSGTVYQKGIFKVQPELYMNGFFKRVNPGLRLVVGL